MFGSQTLEIVIGLVLIFLLVSILLTALSEAIEGILKTRAADLERAIFLYQRMRRAHRALWRWALSSVVILLAPLVCLVAPSEWRFSTFFIGILGELLAVFALLRIHQKWVSCRRDYTRWLRLVHRRVGERES